MPFALVVVGTSLGGFRALKCLLGGLPVDFPLPVAIVQHRGTDSRELAGLLQRYSLLPLSEVEDKEPIVAGRAYLAPPGYHLLVEPGSLALSTDEPVLFARPSIDVLFESAADVYGTGTIGVLLTSSSTDGVAGLSRIRRQGGLAIVQDPATAERATLTSAAIAAGAVHRVLQLEEIAPFLVAASRPTPTR